LAPGSLRLMTRDFYFQLNLCSHNPYVRSCLMRGWVCLLWIGFTFVKCTYCTYSMLLKILAFAVYTSPLSVQALQSRSCLSYLSYATTAAYLLECLWAWLPPSLSLLYFLCLALPYPVLQTCSFSWFYMSSACCLHSFVI
jgi:hypothetical protein